MELIEADFLGHDFGELRFDFISAVTSIRHMPFAEALRKISSSYSYSYFPLKNVLAK